MNSQQSRNEPLDYGVDYERALERLNRKAGAAFRRLNTLRSSRQATPNEIEDARLEAEEAQAQAGSLRVGDIEAIRAILAEG